MSTKVEKKIVVNDKASISLTFSSVVVNVKKLNQRVFWFIFGDAHVGHVSCDFNALRRLIENILKKAAKGPVLVTIMGDMLEATLPNDKTFSTEEHKMTVTEAQKRVIDLLLPLKKHPNVIWNGMLVGNHEGKLLRRGLDPLQAISDAIGIITIGCQTDNMITLKCGKKSGILRSVLAHKINSNAHNGLVKFAKDMLYLINERDQIAKLRLVCVGHNHELYAHKQPIEMRKPESRLVYLSTLHICRTGSFLKTGYDSPSYIISRGVNPKTSGYIEVQFSLMPWNDSGRTVDVCERYDGFVGTPEFKTENEL